MEMKNFYNSLIDKILKNIVNQYDENYDFYRFGAKREKVKILSKIKKLVKKILHIKEIQLTTDQYRCSFNSLLPYLNGIEKLYNLLENERSKELLVELIAYRVLGYKKCKLPLNTPEYWNGIKSLEKYKIPSDYIKIPYPGFENDRLYKHNLLDLNIPISIFYNTKGIYNHLKVKQYEYIDENIKIKINAEDIVLDCGACYGDTALFFANDLNEKGHVYSFEFIPRNIDIFKKNIELNANLNDKITLIPYPLDEFNNRELHFLDSGSGSRVITEPDTNSDVVTTINIDTFFEDYNLKKVDFIKMDIEGSELSALKGARKTIERFRPKLAISIYHSLDDTVNISEHLNSLGLNYKFYLKHGSIHCEETVLLAISL
ncbi:MAG: FkbM family methyltransferase [Treponema sp.]|nr:FkbM family methyltransferase [Treponema sp.]